MESTINGSTVVGDKIPLWVPLSYSTTLPLNLYLISFGVSLDHYINVEHNDVLTKYPYKGD
jgi:hypothetical protein